MTTSFIKYHLLRDRHDERDHYVHKSPNFKLVDPASLPASIDLRKLCSPVADQLTLGSCTANAIAGALEFLENKTHEFETLTHGKYADLSRLFIYYNERLQEGDIRSDDGAQICDGVASTKQYGVPPESVWPYSVRQFAAKPSDEAYKEGLANRTTEYARVSRSSGIVGIKQVLASGYPIVFGFTVYDSFESDYVAQTGIVNMPDSSEQNMGGHAVLMVGYDEPSQRVMVRNSWGSDWGIGGYFTLPYAYVVSPTLASDFWTITK